METAAELARFVAAALPGPEGEPPGTRGAQPGGCGWPSPPPLALRAAGGLDMAWDYCLLASGWPTTRAPNRGWRAGLRATARLPPVVSSAVREGLNGKDMPWRAMVVG